MEGRVRLERKEEGKRKGDRKRGIEIEIEREKEKERARERVNISHLHYRIDNDAYFLLNDPLKA